MYKKSIKSLIFLIALMLTLSACKPDGNDPSQSDTDVTADISNDVTEPNEAEPTNEYGDLAVKNSDGKYLFVPSLWLKYTIDGNAVQSNAVLSKYDWTEGDINASSFGFNPLLSHTMGTQITKTSEISSLNLAFTHRPSSCEAHRWPISYADDNSHIDDYETINCSNGKLNIESGYIYEIIGTWAGGTVSYLLKVS